MENNCNKGIGFVTFRTEEGTRLALAQGYVKYDVFEYPVEQATQSSNHA